MTTAAARADAAKIKKELEKLLKEPANRFCAECNSKQPFWASANLGVFICIKCSGIHRSLGVHISKVKSVSLDSWTAEQVEHMKRWGNERANALYEECMPAGRKPREEDTSYVLESFIRDKYERKIWLKKDVDEEPVATHTSSKRSSKPKKSTKPKPKKPDSDDEQLDTPAEAVGGGDSDEEKPKKSKKKSSKKKGSSAAAAEAPAPAVNTSAAAAAPVINDPFANPTSPTSTAAPATFEPDFSQFQSGPVPTGQPTAFKGGFFTEQKQTTTTTTVTTTTQTSILPQNLFAAPVPVQQQTAPVPVPVARPAAPTTASASLESLLFGGSEPAQTNSAAGGGGGGPDLVGLTGAAPTGPKKDSTASILALYGNKPAAPAQQSFGGMNMNMNMNRGGYPSLQPSYPPAPVYGHQQPMYPPQQMAPYGGGGGGGGGGGMMYPNYPPMQQPQQPMQPYGQPQHMQQFGIYQNRPQPIQQQPMQQLPMGFGSVTPALLPTKNTAPAVDPLSFLM